MKHLLCAFLMCISAVTAAQDLSADSFKGLSSLTRAFDTQDQEFLPQDQAFQLSASARDANTLVASWRIADGYYLYRDKIKFTLKNAASATLGAAQLPNGEVKEDEFFGRMEIYHDDIDAVIPVQRRAPAAALNLQLLVSYQGCAEAGICYPPINKTVNLTLPAAVAATLPATPASPAATSVELPEQDRLAQLLLNSPLWLSMAVFFGLGLGLALTPCVFPMLPILSGIIAGQGRAITTARAFSLSLTYVLAMAVTYTVAGVIAGLFGANLQATFQNPVVLSLFALLFVALALSMFGLYTLQMPGVIQTRLQDFGRSHRGGSFAGAAVMGLLSALIVGPCVAAPLAGALLVIGHSGSPTLGGAALFSLSLGMGVPLLAVGASLGRLLPRAGPWMKAINAVFGVLLLGLAIWMLERILPAAVILVLWAGLCIVSAIYLGAFEQQQSNANGWRKLWKGIGTLLVIWGGLLLLGAASGGADVFQPLRGLSLAGSSRLSAPEHAATAFIRVATAEDLERELSSARSAGRPVMLDFYADWCVSCKEMEKYTFSDQAVRSLLAPAVLLQADVTENTDADKALLRQFNLIGPPSIIFFDRGGAEQQAFRLVGYMGAEEFADHIERAFN